MQGRGWGWGGGRGGAVKTTSPLAVLPMDRRLHLPSLRRGPADTAPPGGIYQHRQLAEILMDDVKALQVAKALPDCLHPKLLWICKFITASWLYRPAAVDKMMDLLVITCATISAA